MADMNNFSLLTASVDKHAFVQKLSPWLLLGRFLALETSKNSRKYA